MRAGETLFVLTEQEEWGRDVERGEGGSGERERERERRSE